MQLFNLQNKNIALSLTNLGAAIQTLCVPDRVGRPVNVVAGFNDISRYGDNPDYLGCIVGRCVNRIDSGRLRIDGTTYQLTLNEDGNHLHGGFEGFSKKVWTVKESTNHSLLLEYYSPDGEEGYPGNLHVTVHYALKDNALEIRYTAETDKPTPVNLTNHTYFNLTGFTDPLVTNHELKVNAREYSEKNLRNLPTGRLLPVADTPLDFKNPQCIGKNIDAFPRDHGYDHNFVLDRPHDGPTLRAAGAVPAAELYDPTSGRLLTVFTDQPCLQVYTANWWTGAAKGPQGVDYVQHGAVALETQNFPDAPNHGTFPSGILRPGSLYKSTTIFEFGTK